MFWFFACEPCGILGSPTRDWRRKWPPTPVLLPGKSHGQRSLASYSPRGRKELDTTERLHFTSNWTHIPCTWRQSLSNWTTRKVLDPFTFQKFTPFGHRVSRILTGCIFEGNFQEKDQLNWRLPLLLQSVPRLQAVLPSASSLAHSSSPSPFPSHSIFSVALDGVPSSMIQSLVHVSSELLVAMLHHAMVVFMARQELELAEIRNAHLPECRPPSPHYGRAVILPPEDHSKLPLLAW